MRNLAQFIKNNNELTPAYSFLLLKSEPLAKSPSLTIPEEKKVEK